MWNFLAISKDVEQIFNPMRKRRIYMIFGLAKIKRMHCVRGTIQVSKEMNKYLNSNVINGVHDKGFWKVIHLSNAPSLSHEKDDDKIISPIWEKSHLPA